MAEPSPPHPALELRVTPRAAGNRVGPMREGVLQVSVTAAPAGGAANRAVLELLARALRVAPSSLAIVAGERGRRKRVRIAGLTGEEVERRLARALGGEGRSGSGR